jgi:hypothetical protein
MCSPLGTNVIRNRRIGLDTYLSYYFLILVSTKISSLCRTFSEEKIL